MICVAVKNKTLDKIVALTPPELTTPWLYKTENSPKVVNMTKTIVSRKNGTFAPAG
jgi:hypothetical protein